MMSLKQKKMTPKRDYYQVLGISPGATTEEIKRAFRRLAFQYHPDHNHQEGAAERFKEINTAYQVLSDPEKRANYDRFGYPEAEVFGRGFEGFGDFVSGIGDIFEAFFGGTTTVRRRVPQQGADLYCKATISFEEMVLGCEKEIEIVRTERCSFCRGLGSEPGSQPVKCSHCEGTGEVRRMYRSIFGRFVNRVTCERCHGEGSIITQPCPQCQGTGRERKHHRITVKIPAGVEDGSQIRLTGEGEAGRWGGSPGNLYITLLVQEHEFFKREGNDILYELPINFAQAALGDEVEIPTIEGKASIKVPPGTQAGKVIQLKGKGIPHRSGRGNLLVKIRVVTPEKLDHEQRQLFQELARSLGKVTMPGKGRKRRFFSE